ncbi:MAG: guanylate kinase [Pseudomonadota bacterium]
MSSQVFVVAAPSGAGKTSLVRALVERSDNLQLSVSHTTRDPRSGEVDGEHYHFIDMPAYEALVAADAFLEHAMVHGNGYGSGVSEVERAAVAGADLLLEIDWQGAQQVKQALPNAISIFILPPSRAALAERLRGRGQDSDAVIARRLAAAQSEMVHWEEFDYVVVNDDFEVALTDLAAIVTSARLAQGYQGARLEALLKDLLDH